MPELATAWVTLAATTRGMEGDIRRAVDRASGAAKINPKVNTSGLSSQASKAGREFGDRFSSSAKDAMKAISVAVVGASVVDQFKQVMSVGMDWTNTQNTLQAVTGATTEQMKQAGAAARALGNDVSLPATSANDAAAAMTELAKGGFSVQQSMDAAKGTLQLAAAAQIGAADAATIQSQALQAFGLNASDAGKMSDTLANAANASSAEITDVAQAMAQAGTVANQFGLSAQDTASAIGLLANNGIKGSDAGTLLKSSLLALTDQGKPAQGAIEQLGLTVYDAQGKFVGLHTLFGQLGQASKSMTPEMYQAATATLFGSDAMRLAGVAAKDGSQSYDLMRTAIDRQGAASDVAAAKTRGLPGAWERVKNAIESLQLQAYDKLEGPVTGLLDGLSGGLGDVVPKLSAAWQKLSANPAVVGTLQSTAGAFKSLASSAAAVWPSLVRIGTSLAAASAALGVSSWKIFVASLQAAAGVLDAMAPVLATVAGLMTSHQGVVVAAAAAWLAFKTVPGLLTRVGSALSPLTTAATNAGNAFRGFGQEMRLQQTLARMGGQNIGTMGAAFSTLQARATGALRGIRTSLSGLVGAMGGPFGVGLAAATVGIGLIASASADAKKRTRELADEQANLATKARETYDLLSKSGGSVNESVIGKSTEQIDALQQKFDTLRTGASVGDWLSDVFTPANGDPIAAFGASLDKQHGAEKIERIKTAMQGLGTTSQSMGVLISGGSEAWAEFSRNAEAAGQGGQELLNELRPLREEFLNNQAAAKSLTPGFTGIRDAIKTIADAASTAEDKTNAFKTALDTLAGVKPDVQKATDQYNSTIRDLAPKAEDGKPAVADSKDGAVKSRADGTIDTSTKNAHDLYDALNQIKDATAGVAGAGGELAPVLAQNDKTLGDLATKYGLTKSQVDAYAASLGYIPQNVTTLAQLKGATDVQQQIGVVRELLTTVPEGKTITVDAPPKAAIDQLTSVGLKVREFDGPGGHKMIEVTAPNGQVLGQLDQVIAKLGQVQSSVPKIDFNNGLGLGAGGLPGASRERRGVNADGSIVPMANGGFRQIAKPGMADIYAGRGAGTIFAEQETGGEAYIPLAPGKRSRSRRILSEVARLFGMNVMEDGGITVEAIKQYASQLSGGRYVRGGPAGLDGTDCSGAQAAMANFITGGTGRFGTQTEGAELAGRGFMQGDPPPGVAAYWIGWKNGGPGGGHTAGTILDPNGGNVNVEMGGANGGGAFGGGAQGASAFPNRAWIQIAGGEDPNAANDFSGGGSSAAVQSASARVTSSKASVTSAQASLDQANAAVADAQSKGKSTETLEKKRDAAQQRLDAATQRQAAAETKLAEVKEKATDGSGKSGGMDASSLGSTFVSGIFESLGVPGFNNLLDSPNAKSAKALLNYGLGFLGGGQDQTGAGGDPGGFGGALGLPNLPSLLNPMGGPQATSPVDPNTLQHGQAGGALPGPTVNYTMNGVDPKAGFQKADAHANQTYRKNLAAVRPGG